jgi:hypothetical protein
MSTWRVSRAGGLELDGALVHGGPVAIHDRSVALMILSVSGLGEVYRCSVAVSERAVCLPSS